MSGMHINIEGYKNGKQTFQNRNYILYKGCNVACVQQDYVYITVVAVIWDVWCLFLLSIFSFPFLP